MKAPKHPREEERLSLLREYDVLDTEAETRFDEIAELAGRICDAPVSLVSLVDADRQWFKARVGFEPEETSLEESVCAHAILGDELFEVMDLTADPRTADNPLVTGGPEVRFYAGANLTAPGGLPLGTLCVLDTEPRELTELQRKALRVLSRQVVTELELRRKLRQEQALRSEMDHRISNSLQGITSLLRLSAREVKDPAAQEVIAMLSRQITAVGSLHRELMVREGAGVVDVQSYLGRVIENLSRTCPPGVTLTAEIAALDIEAPLASALGVIASEFVANSIKYGFPEGRGGEIRMTLAPDDDGLITFACRDNGLGSAAGSSGSAKDGEVAGTGTGLGSALMSSAADQLGGTFHQQIEAGGAQVTIRFGLPPQ